MSSLLAGRRGLIVGVANDRSLAAGIARSAAAQGARLALTYQSERLQGRVGAIAEALGAELLLPLDLTDESQLAAAAAKLTDHFGALDFVVHAVAFARAEDLTGRFIETSREGFAEALDISTYSLVALARSMEALLVRGDAPSLLTLTYLGSSRALPRYNVMGVAKAALESTVRYLAYELGPAGIRVNALSPGPVKTLSAASIKGLRTMLNWNAEQAPLRRNVDADDVGAAALFALSRLGRGTTGEIIHVDGGYHIVGAPKLDDEERPS